MAKPERKDSGQLSRITPSFRACWLVGAQSILRWLLLLLDGCFGVVYRAWQCVRTLTCARAARDAGGVRKTVVIVGGSFGGLAALHEMATHPAVQVVLIDQRNFFEYTPGLLRLFCNPSMFHEMARETPQGAHRFVQGVASAMHSDHVVVTDPSGKSTQIAFDYLIVATGADYRQPITATAAESTLTARQATWRREAARLKAAESVLVLGGGAVGAELAAEVVCHFPNKRVTIVDGQSHLVPLFPQQTVQYVEKWFRDRGAELLLGQSLDRWDDSGCWMRDGRVIKADIVYVCFGMRSNSQAVMAGGMAECLGPRMEIRVNEHLQVDGQPCVFAVGDVMSNPSGEIKQAYYAEMNGALVGRNVLRHVEGRKLLRFPEDIAGAGTVPLVYVVSLGRYDGSLGFNRLVVNGAVAALLKWFIEWTKIRQMEGRPVGAFVWKLGDAVTFFLSRWCLKPSVKDSA